MDEEWLFWRPIVEGMATYSEMKQLTLDEIMTFNFAITKQIELVKAANKNK